jgi:eukaryotic-like serine/threonine-protein kinase
MPHSGVYFIAMEFVAGTPLDRLIPRQGLELNTMLKYGIQVADALAAAHAAGIVHRDLKPANLMVTDRGLVKVLDFGLAKLAEGPAIGESDDTETLVAALAKTEEGVILGTVSYMSPEQAEGKPVDARSDIFSLGSVLYEMVTGRKAFQGESKVSTLTAILRDEPKSAREIVTGLPKDVERIVSRCLRKEMSRRFQSMDDVRVELQDLKEDSDSSRLLAAPSSAALNQAARAVVKEAPSIAVLPFASMSSDAENEYFSDGISEEIINALGQVEGPSRRRPNLVVFVQGQIGRGR